MATILNFFPATLELEDTNPKKYRASAESGCPLCVSMHECVCAWQERAQDMM